MTAKIKIQGRIDDSLKMFNEGFTTKAAQKRALESLSRAYTLTIDGVRTLINNVIRETYKDEIAANGGTRPIQAHDPRYDTPLELHHWRTKHRNNALDVANESPAGDVEQMTWMVDKIDELFKLRNTIKDTPIVAASKAAALKIDTLNPITAAIEPLRKISVDNAESKALQVIAKVHAELAAGGYDINIAAPRLHAFRCSPAEYSKSVAKHSLFSRLTDRKDSVYGSGLRVPSQEAEARFIEQTKNEASLQFDKYVAKMIDKIGSVTSAELDNNFTDNIWAYSILKVKTVDGKHQQWKTQQIVNVSKLGKVFNQWPTRQQ